VSEDRKATKWRPGQSGNPSGRPRGISSAASLRNRLGKDLDAIVDKLVALAKEGDVQASRALLERCIPTLKPTEVPAAIPMPEGGGLVACGEAILQAAASGHLAPGQAGQLLAGLGCLAKLRESEELEARIEALEAAAKGGKQ